MATATHRRCPVCGFVYLARTLFDCETLGIELNPTGTLEAKRFGFTLHAGPVPSESSLSIRLGRDPMTTNRPPGHVNARPAIVASCPPDPGGDFQAPPPPARWRFRTRATLLAVVHRTVGLPGGAQLEAVARRP